MTDVDIMNEYRLQEAGRVSETQITDVKVDKVKVLMPKEMIENSKYPIDLEADVCMITCENGAVEYMNLPNDKIIKPKSKLYKFVNKYNAMPHRGQHVYTQIDVNGFERLLY
ncbi:MAG: hypothetical protein QXU98_04150 [Candidatus Parvarchaeota archaeon]